MQKLQHILQKNKIVGVIGTDGTIRSKAYNTEIAKIDSNIKIVDKSCPLFVPIVEEGWANTDIASLTAKRYLQELMDKGIDSLVLGCTHYPLLKKTIGEIVGEKVKLVNPAKETAKDLKQILEITIYLEKVLNTMLSMSIMYQIYLKSLLLLQKNF